MWVFLGSLTKNVDRVAFIVFYNFEDDGLNAINDETEANIPIDVPEFGSPTVRTPITATDTEDLEEESRFDVNSSAGDSVTSNATWIAWMAE